MADIVRQNLLLVPVGVLILFMAGCAGGSTFMVGTHTNSNPPSSSTVTISLQSASPGSVAVSSKTAFSAVVTNDPSNYGVDWTASCAAANAANCGSLSFGANAGQSIHTASGQAVTYTAPSTFTGSQLSVSIVAFATADHSKNVVAPIKVVAFSSNLKGTYVFHAQGSNQDANTGVVGPYQIAGAITLDGNGGVTGGEQTFTDSSIFGSTAITGGSYFLGADGRGTLTIDTNDPTLGSTGVESFSLVSLDPSDLLIAQIDSVASAAGAMELRTSAAIPSGSYVFAVSGTGGGAPTAFGGVLNIDQPGLGVISGKGSVADQGSITTTAGKTTVKVKNCIPPSGGTVASINGTVLPIPSDPYNAVQLNLTTCFASTPLQFMGYIVNATHISLIETDVSGNTGFSTSGVAISQGSSAGTFSGLQSFSGAYVFAVSGFDKSKFASSLASAGQMVADGVGNVAGLLDQYGFSATRNFSGTLNGAYTIDSSGIGRVDAKTLLVGSNGVSSNGPEFIFYLAGTGNSPLVLAFDTTALAVGAGMAYPQAAPPYQFNGDYAVSGVDLPKRSAGSLTGEAGQFSVTLDQTSANLNLAGILDDTATLGDSLTGSFSLPSASGRSSGSLLASSLTGPNSAATGVYMVDDQHGFFVETDSGFQGPVFQGYFAARTPVCPKCP
jgi:hypothetical protein